MDVLQWTDPEVWQAIQAERDRQQVGLEMIASENYTSPAVMAAQGSVLTNKYAEGYPGRRYYGGCENVDVVERLAIDRLLKLFGADRANVQPHSGAQANTAVFFAAMEPGDGIEVDPMGVGRNAVGDRLEPLARQADLHPVRQMSAVSQVESKEGIAWLHRGEKDGRVRLGPGVRLDVGPLGPEQLQDPVDGQPLDSVHELAAAVVPPAGVAFRVLVGQRRPLGGHDGRAGVVLRRDHLQALLLAVALGLNRLPHLGVGSR